MRNNNWTTVSSLRSEHQLVFFWLTESNLIWEHLGTFGNCFARLWHHVCWQGEIWILAERCDDVSYNRTKRHDWSKSQAAVDLDVSCRKVVVIIAEISWIYVNYCDVSWSSDTEMLHRVCRLWREDLWDFVPVFIERRKENSENDDKCLAVTLTQKQMDKMK